ncbi:MAG: calcium/sodium antiporter [Actinomycetota bacterium]
MTVLALLALVVGLAVLVQAADHFVDGAVRLANRTSLTPVVVGAVVLGFGTSAPELLVSGLAARQGDAAFGIGNIVGSNIANLSLVLGAAALVARLPLPPTAIRREAPLAIGSGLLFAVVVQGGIGRAEGLVLLVLMISALTWLLVAPGEDDVVADAVDSVDSAGSGLVVELVRTAVALVATLVGARLVVWGAGSLAEALGVSTGMVGLTIVAVGTSLPELVTVIVAARRAETGLIVGNLLGSNLFNSLSVGAAVGLLGNGAAAGSAVAITGASVMVLVSLVALVFMITKRVVVRWEGVVLLGLYAITVTMVGAGP